MQETWIQSLIGEDPLEEGMATRSSVLAWRIPWILAGCSPWGHKVLDTTEVTENACKGKKKKRGVSFKFVPFFEKKGDKAVSRCEHSYFFFFTFNCL